MKINNKDIVFKNVSKEYDSKYIYKKFNLTIKSGKVTVILGPSGCGKTTLLNMLANLTSYKGSITKARCSYVLQDPALVPSLTVYQNLELVNNDPKKIMDVLKIFELTAQKDRYPITLSQGQRHRVSLARALIYDSDVILMDEPFSTLDLKLRIKLMNQFATEVVKNHKTAICVTHDIDEAIVLGNRILVLKNGQITFDKKETDKVPRTYGSRDELRQALIAELIK